MTYYRRRLRIMRRRLLIRARQYQESKAKRWVLWIAPFALVGLFFLVRGLLRADPRAFLALTVLAMSALFLIMSRWKPR